MSTVQLADLTMRPLVIPFRGVFSHAAARRGQTESVWVQARSRCGLTGHGEGCPRSYVTGESTDSAMAFLARYRGTLLRRIQDLESLAAWVAAHRTEIDANPAAWCAVELALLDLLGRAREVTVEALLGLAPVAGAYRYSAVIGDDAPDVFAARFRRYREAGFTDFKLKLSGDRAREQARVGVLGEEGVTGLRVRLDANNLWSCVDTARTFLGGLEIPFWAIEEPLRAGDHAGLARLGEALGRPVILDESLLRREQLSRLAGGPERWIVNLRVSKMGGLMRSLEVVAGARTLGVPLIVGAQVGETSLLTRAAFTVATAAGDMVVAREGAAGTHLLAWDICEPSLMFGAGGVLRPGNHFDPAAPGFGLAVSSPA